MLSVSVKETDFRETKPIGIHTDIYKKRFITEMCLHGCCLQAGEPEKPIYNSVQVQRTENHGATVLSPRVQRL